MIASEKASLGLPEIDVGLLGGQRHAQRLFSHSRLRTIALTGQRIGGAELYRTGVVEACVAPDDLMDEAMEKPLKRRTRLQSFISLFGY